MDVAEILNITQEAVEEKTNEQLNEDIENERLLAITEESTQSIDTLREQINVSKSDYIKAERLSKEMEKKDQTQNWQTVTNGAATQ